MEIYKAVQTIEAVANGTNPLTGEAFPPDSPYNSPEIIRALFACTQYIRRPPEKTKKTLGERQAENQHKGLPRNAGLSWSQKERAEVARLYKAGEHPSNLAKKFERTQNAIILELQKQGVISEEDAQGLK